MNKAHKLNTGRMCTYLQCNVEKFSLVAMPQKDKDDSGATEIHKGERDGTSI